MLTNLYYGLPQTIWNSLSNKAEDLFYKESIGQLILGLYPIGNRIFGLETASPELLCLYLDSEEEILNPLSNINKPAKIPTNHSGSYIHFLNLWTWVASFPNKITMNTILPCFGDSIYQEELIDEIIFAAKEFIINYPKFRIDKNYDLYLQMRSRFILETHRVFRPNINSEWDTILQSDLLDLPIEIKKNDKQIIKQKLGNQHISFNTESLYTKTLSKIIMEQTEEIDFNYNKLLSKIGQETSKFLRKVI